MAYINYSSPSTASIPAWVGDELKQREHVVEVGALLQAADFTAQADGSVYVEGGTLVGRTYAERDAGTGFGPYSEGNAAATPPVPADEEVYLLLHDVEDANVDASATFYRPGSVVYENFLPTATQAAALLAVVRSLYLTKVGDN